MSRPGDPDPLYVAARSVLLDAVDALGPHRSAVTLVGAQAVYIHTGSADLAVAEFTTDADLALSPDLLGEAPLIEDLMTNHGFVRGADPGGWRGRGDIAVDLMVPAALSGPGTRGARLGVHGKWAARRSRGLEGALVDRSEWSIASLDPEDHRHAELFVAGPAALLVAKAHKIGERVGTTRATDKDALDVFRLLQAVPTGVLADGFAELRRHQVSSEVTDEAIGLLGRLFATRRAEGGAMVIRAAGEAADPLTLLVSMEVLMADLLEVVE